MAKRKPSTGIQKASQALVAPSPLVEAELKAMEKAIGGREALVAALAHAPKSRDLEYLLGLIGDPENSRVPLGLVCAQGGITPGEILQAYKSGILAKGQVLAAKQIAEGLPAAVADTMRLAAPYTDTCSNCRGLTRVTPEPTKEQPNPEPVNCPVCDGTGELLYPASFDHKKLALELGGLTGKGGGILVQVNNQQNTFSGGQGGGLEALMAQTDTLLYEQEEADPDSTAPAPPVDGEVLGEAE